MRSVEIRNVKVFDGVKMTNCDKVVIKDGRISGDDNGEIIVDGEGGTLLPGFIDSHVHLYEKSNLEEMCKYGVTVAFDMASRSADLVSAQK